MSQHPLYDSLWEKAAQRFPQLVEQFGQAPPRDATGNPSTAALDALLALQSQARVRPPTAPQRDFADITAKSYWDPGEWARRGKEVLAGAAQLPVSLPGIYKTVRGAVGGVEELQPGAGLGTKAAAAAVGAVGPELKALEAIDEAVAPARGAFLASRPGGVFGGKVGRESILPRYNALRDQGMDSVSAYAAAYEQAKAAGEIPLSVSLPLEFATDPIELLPGGFAASIGRKAVRGVLAGGRAVAPKAAAAAVAPRYDIFTGAPIGTAWMQSQPRQRALPLLEGPEGAVRAITPEEQAGQLRLGQVAEPAQAALGAEPALGAWRRMPGIPAEELARRQAEAPGPAPAVARPTQLWAGKPNETLWDPTTGTWLKGLHIWKKATKSRPGGWVLAEPKGLREWEKATIDRPGGWVSTEAGEQARQQARHMDVAADIRQAAPAHPFDELVTEAMEGSLEKLVRYRENHSVMGGALKGWHTRWTNDVAAAMFGEANPQTRRSINEYVRHLTGEKAIKTEMEAAQRELPLGLGPPGQEQFPGLGIGEAARKPLINLEDYFYRDPQTNEWLRRKDVPWPAQSVYRTHEEALDLDAYRKRLVPEGGVPAGKQASRWVKDDQFAFHEEEAAKDSSKILEQMVATPDEMAFTNKSWGDISKPEAKGRFQSAIRIFFGTMRLHETRMEDVILNGRRELQELGWLDKDSFPTAEGLGTLEEPGGLRILYYTLDDKIAKLGGTVPVGPDGKRLSRLQGEWGQRLQALGPVAVRQFHNLKAYASWEEIHSVSKDLIKAPDPAETYFHRGWRIPEGGWANIENSAERYSTGGALGRRAGAFQKRNNVPFPEMEKLGFEPTFWNPYEMAMIRSRMGMQTRLQIHLVDMLKNEKLGLARHSSNLQTLDEWRRDGWIPVTNAGPALKGDTFVGVNKKFTNALNPDEHAEVRGMQWVFPKNVAGTLEQMFAPRKWAAMRTKKRFARLGIDVKFDDLFYIPKRAKLFGSFFQQADFASRTGFSGTGTALYRVIEGLKLMGKGGLTSDPDAFHQGFQHLVAAHTHLINAPKGWRDMARGFVSPNYREHLRKELISTKSYYDDPALAEYTTANLVKYGLHVRDATIFDVDDGIQMLQRAVERGRIMGGVAKMGRGLKSAEMAMRRGLFDGVYPAAILQDVKYNLVPLVRATNPDMSPAQIMGIVAKRANKRWSTIPVEQSVVRGHMREALTRTSFSLNENESFFRQMTGAVRGPEKLFWATHWAGAFIFMAAVGNLIHFMTTTRFKEDEKGRFAGVDWGEGLPVGRYMPFHLRGWYTFGYGYNPAFLNPNIPVPTRAGDEAMLDLLMQFDFMFRLTDGAYGLPGLSFLNARLGTTPRAILTQGTSRDYMGRDIGEWGYLQRALQFVYDELAPIGAGQVAVAVARTAFKDRDLPELKPFGMPLVRKGANIDRLTPSVEAKLQFPGIAIQGIGLNLKTSSNEMLRDRMVERVFGEGKHPDYPGLVLKRGRWPWSPGGWEQLKKHKDAPILTRIMYQDARNAREVREIGERQQEGAEYWYDDYGKMAAETRESAKKRLEAEATIVDRTTKTLWDPKDPTAWSPSTFRDELRAINKRHRITTEAIKKVYGEDPRVAAIIEEREKEPDRAEEPLYWAIWHWARLRNEHKDPITGVLDYDAFDVEWEAIISSYDDETTEERGESTGLAERFNKWLDQGEHHPFVQQYYDALGQIDDSGYWEDKKFEPDEMALLKQALDPMLAPIGKTADQIWSEYLKAPAEERRRLQRHPNQAIQRIIKIMDSTRKHHRYKTVMENPEIDQLLIMWFGNTPYIYENGAFYQKLYANPPRSYRQDPWN